VQEAVLELRLDMLRVNLFGQSNRSCEFALNPLAAMQHAAGAERQSFPKATCQCDSTFLKTNARKARTAPIESARSRRATVRQNRRICMSKPAVDGTDGNPSVPLLTIPLIDTIAIGSNNAR